jgi:nitrogen fixation NifU-like protein
MVSGYDKWLEIVRSEMLKKFSEKVVDHCMNPRNMGSLDNFNGYAKIKGPCGDTMKIFLKIDNKKIEDAKFLANGCGITNACGSILTELIKDKNITDSEKIESKDILDAFGGLPESHIHCSVLATNTFKEAIKNYYNFINKENYYK